MKHDFNFAEVAQRLAYDPLTGLFTRLVAAGGQPIGAIAGCINAERYVQLDVLGVKLLGHRLAWFMTRGEWPPFDIDHRDTVRHHNWIDNLRPATRAQNMQNLREPQGTNRVGLLGVMPSRNGKRYIAQIRRTDGNPSHYIGTFDTAEQAHAAYLAAKVKQHPFQTLVPT